VGSVEEHFLERAAEPQISPLRYAPVEMTKVRVVMARSRGLAIEKPQVPLLRYATPPVGMTKVRVVMARSRGLAIEKPQVPPLRYPPVGMTRRDVALPGKQSLNGPHDSAAERRGKNFPFRLLRE
jgi:hypothetical protein